MTVADLFLLAATIVACVTGLIIGWRWTATLTHPGTDPNPPPDDEGWPVGGGPVLFPSRAGDTWDASFARLLATESTRETVR